MRIAWIVAGVALINSSFWLFRLSSFRKDRVWERRASLFAQPFDWSSDILKSSNYLPEGKFYFRCYVISVAVWIAALVVALWLSI